MRITKSTQSLLGDFSYSLRSFLQVLESNISLLLRPQIGMSCILCCMSVVIEVMLLWTFSGSSKDTRVKDQPMLLKISLILRLSSSFVRGTSMMLHKEVVFGIQLVCQTLRFEVVEGSQRIPLIQRSQPFRMAFQMKELLVCNLLKVCLASKKVEQGAAGMIRVSK